MSEVRLQVNAPQVIHETIDGEVIIINLGTGSYYSLKGSGAAVWDVVQQSPGATVDDLVNAVAAVFARAPAEIDSQVRTFVDDLCAEELLVDAPAGEDSPSAETAARTASSPFEPPVLEKYTDMQDLVLLDPVHEVDATGWPQPRPEAPAAGSAA